MNSIWIALLLLKRTLSSRRSILTGIVVPAVVVLALTIAAGRQASQVVIPVLNQDQGGLGEALLNSVRAEMSGITFSGVKSNQTPQVIIPSDFSESVSNGRTSSVIIKGIPDSAFALSLQDDLTARIGRLQDRATQLRAAGLPADQLPDRLLIEVSNEQADRLPALRPVGEVNPWMKSAAGIALVFMITFVSGSVMHILDDRDRLTMLRMFASPVRSAEISFGYVLGGFLTGSLQSLVLLLVVHFESLGNIRSLGGIWLILECFLLAAIGMTCLLASLAKTGQSLSGFVTMAIIPTCMLGGCFWPAEMMPDYMQKLAAFVPQSWALDAWMRAASGDTVAEYANSIVVLLLFAAVLLSVGATILRPGDTAARH